MATTIYGNHHIWPTTLMWQGEDEDAPRVPTDRPLQPHEADLLSHPEVSIAALREGDLLVFSSAASHFASNAASGRSVAGYHGAVTHATLPRLEAAAREDGDGRPAPRPRKSGGAARAGRSASRWTRGASSRPR